MKQTKINAHQLLLQVYTGRELFNSSSIIRIEARSSYSKLFFDNGNTLVVARTLRWFEGRLPAQQFIRTHRTHVVNKDFINWYLNGTQSKVYLVNGEQVEVAKRRRKFVFATNAAA
jgi:two-component system LytT family response regulator